MSNLFIIYVLLLILLIIVYTNKLNNIILVDIKHFSLYCTDYIYIYLFLEYNT